MYLEGKDLRQIRLKTGFTSTRLAEFAHLKSGKTFENWERGKGGPSVNQFITICYRCRLDAPVFIQALVERAQTGEPLDYNAAIRPSANARWQHSPPAVNSD